MLQTATLPGQTLALLKALQRLPELKDYRLVGGTALALQLGHRRSVDLDFFSHTRERIACDELTGGMVKAGFKVTPVQQSNLICVLDVNGVKVDVVNYPYGWIDEPVEDEGIRMAGIKDIVAMKLAAITNRGTKKDFVDVYRLLSEYPLSMQIQLYGQKYSSASVYNVLRSLVYFEDAESDPMPKLFVPMDWSVIKKTLRKAVTSLAL
jgi:predicted nucleotidyltransferase component of viral defense system